MKPLAAAALVALYYVLHQDVWFWREARPLVFGFLPIGLFYHAAYTAACSLLLWLLVKSAWPAHLDSRLTATSRPGAATISRYFADVAAYTSTSPVGPSFSSGDSPDLKVGPTERS